MSSYFTFPSFARAKQNHDALEKTNPQRPVLDDEAEKFLEKQISNDKDAGTVPDVQPIKISDGGEEKNATFDEQKKAGAGPEQIAIPETQPSRLDGVADSNEAVADTASPSSPKKPKKKKKKNFDLPSQEEAEKATQGWDAAVSDRSLGQAATSSGEKRTWASYIPSMKIGAKKNASSEEKTGDQENAAEHITDNDPEAETSQQKDESSNDGASQRTWAQYASSYVPQSWTKPKDKDASAEPVYNEDGTIDEVKTKEKQEKEVSVLLDKLDMSSINNRVFALSGETQKIYDRFAQVLKDTINGAPTAYDDMEKLMHDAGPQLEKQFQSMPPFVQTLVKSLPMKLGSTLGPELLAASSEKPGNDLKAKLNATNRKASSSGTSTPPASGKGAAKNKRKVPGLKGLISSEGAIAGMLRNVVNFLRVRFPFLASGTNVVMSLAVFLLMFSFYYCHKRGKEVRLARAAEAEQGGEGSEVEDDDDEYEVEDEEEDTEGGADSGNEKDTNEPNFTEEQAEATLPGSEATDMSEKQKAKATS